MHLDIPLSFLFRVKSMDDIQINDYVRRLHVIEDL
jgi:hypothetical protein